MIVSPCFHRYHHYHYQHQLHYSQPSTRRPQEYTPVVRLLQAHHNNAPIVVTTPRVTPITTPIVVRIPTPIPTTSNSLVRYVSPLITRFNPCSGCGSADNHFPGCTNWSRSLQKANRGVVLRFFILFFIFSFKNGLLIVFFFCCDILFYLCLFVVEHLLLIQLVTVYERVIIWVIGLTHFMTH